MNVHSLLSIPTMIAPDALAVIDERGNEWTYQELSAAVDDVAALLIRRGVSPGDRVALMSTNRVDALAAIFASAAIGAVSVPLNFRAGSEELRHLVHDADPRVLFHDARYRDQLIEVLDANLLVDLDAVGRSTGDVEIEVVEEPEVATILYTSGTTSQPKGVPLRHEALTSYVMEANDAHGGDEQGRMLLAAPLHHVAGLTSVYNAMYAGRVTVLIPQFDAGVWIDAVERHAVTHAFLVPTMLARVLASDRFDAARLQSLESVTYGAAPMPPSVIEEAIERFPEHVEFSGAYGQTETTSTVAVLGPEDHRLQGSDADIARVRERLRSVGRVVDDVDVAIVDETGAPLPANSTGEVWLRTGRAMRGYWGSTGSTRITIDDAGWVHTGDLGRIDDDGYLFLVGRTGDMIIRGGENISPEEVEAALHAHPDVDDVGVVGRADEEWGEQVVAYVVPRRPIDVADLETWARAHLTSFKRPSTYHLVDALPRTSTGKLVRRRLGTE